MTLALTNSKDIPVFANYSGLESPTYLQDKPEQTIQTLFGGSQANYNAHNPPYLLAHQQYAGMAGWFEAGAQDSFGGGCGCAPPPGSHPAGDDRYHGIGLRTLRDDPFRAAAGGLRAPTAHSVARSIALGLGGHGWNG